MASPFKLRMRTAGAMGGGGVIGGGGGAVIPPEYFGMHIGHLPPTTIWGDYSTSARDNYRQVPWPDMHIGALRLWDADGCSWRNVERTHGTFTWDRLDFCVNAALAQGVKIVICLGGACPDWATASAGAFPGTYVGYNPNPPSDNAYWSAWCAAVGARYAGHGIYYEIWNEFNNSPADGPGYTGTIAQLVTLAQLARTAILAVDATAKFLTPNSVGQDALIAPNTSLLSMDQYLAAGGGAYADIIAIHGYNTMAPWMQPEGMITYGHRAKLLLASYGQSAKPVWNTEWGFGQWQDETGDFRSEPGGTPFPDFMPEQRGADVTTRMLLLSWLAGFSTTFFYGLDAALSYASIVMVDAGATGNASVLLKPALAFKYLAGLLVGGQLSGLQSLADATGHAYFKAAFTAGDGRIGRVYWCADYQTASIPIPGASEVRDNLGASVTVTSSLAATMSPKFVFF